MQSTLVNGACIRDGRLQGTDFPAKRPAILAGGRGGGDITDRLLPFIMCTIEPESWPSIEYIASLRALGAYNPSSLREFRILTASSRGEDVPDGCTLSSKGKSQSDLLNAVLYCFGGAHQTQPAHKRRHRKTAPRLWPTLMRLSGMTAGMRIVSAQQRGRRLGLLFSCDICTLL